MRQAVDLHEETRHRQLQQAVDLQEEARHQQLRQAVDLHEETRHRQLRLAVDLYEEMRLVRTLKFSLCTGNLLLMSHLLHTQISSEKTVVCLRLVYSGTRLESIILLFWGFSACSHVYLLTQGLTFFGLDPILLLQSVLQMSGFFTIF